MDNWNNFVELNKNHIFSAIIDDNYDDLQNISCDYISKLKSIRKTIIDALICKESVGGDVPIYKLNNKAFVWYIHIYERFTKCPHPFQFVCKLYTHANSGIIPHIIFDNIYHIKIQPRNIHIHVLGINQTKRYISNVSELLDIIENIEDYWLCIISSI